MMMNLAMVISMTRPCWILRDEFGLDLSYRVKTAKTSLL